MHISDLQLRLFAHQPGKPLPMLCSAVLEGNLAPHRDMGQAWCLAYPSHSSTTASAMVVAIAAS